VTDTNNPLILGRYHLLKQLGEGGMASVFMALDPVLERTLAIKMIRTELSSNDIMMFRFINEAKVYASLGHANVVTIYDYGVYSHIQYIAMEYVDGPNLSQLRSMNGVSLSESALYSIIHQVAEGLAVAHGHGIIHRDIKPENIMINTSGTVKITDFGIAHQQFGPQMTSTGTILGSPNYMAPEQLNGEKPTSATDIYAFGAVLYFLCTGSEPYKASSMAQLFKAIAIDDPIPVCSVNPAISPELSNLIATMMSKQPANRSVDALKLCQIGAGWLHKNGIASGTMLLKRDLSTTGFRPNPTLSEGDTRQVYQKISRDFAAALTTSGSAPVPNIETPPAPAHAPAASPAIQKTKSSSNVLSAMIVAVFVITLLGVAAFLFVKGFSKSQPPAIFTGSNSILNDDTVPVPPTTNPPQKHDTLVSVPPPPKRPLPLRPHTPGTPTTEATSPLTASATNYQDLKNRQKREQFDFMLASIKKGDVPGMSDAISVVSEYLSTDAHKSLLLTEAIIAAAPTNEQAKSMLEIMRYMRIASLFVLKQYQKVTLESAQFISMYPNGNYTDAVKSFLTSAKQMAAAFGG